MRLPSCPKCGSGDTRWGGVYWHYADSTWLYAVFCNDCHCEWAIRDERRTPMTLNPAYSGDDPQAKRFAGLETD